MHDVDAHTEDPDLELEYVPREGDHVPAWISESLNELYDRRHKVVLRRIGKLHLAVSDNALATALSHAKISRRVEELHKKHLPRWQSNAFQLVVGLSALALAVLSVLGWLEAHHAP